MTLHLISMEFWARIITDYQVRESKKCVAKY